ncbi:MAG TPA: mobile mystery protein B [Puia sp.]|nr:mobile mystery protein B [Puia sp.]
MGLTGIGGQEGQTPIDTDEKEGLLIYSITTRQELDELEQRNIGQAIRWILERRKKFTVAEVLTAEFVRELHNRMFGDTWRWAGKFRMTDKNLGVDKFQITVSLHTLLEDCKYWIENRTYGNDEIAIRLKHRIVSIHCFPNGNGRHSRLMADIMIEKVLGEEVFSWGGKTLTNPAGSRTRYLAALKAADQGRYKPLIEFSRL